MDASMDSDQYVRYMLMREIYHEAKQAAAEITEAAGVPMRSACDLDLVKRKGLSEQVATKTARLTDKLYMAADIIDDEAATTMKNAAPYMFTALRYTGAPLHANEVELSIRSNIVVNNRKSKGPFPNWKAAENFSALQTFSATCRKNGVSPYEATIKMAQDPDWDIFTNGIPPPIMAHVKRPAGGSTRP